VISYFPFEWLAKFSLIVFALLFILDPFPPTSRVMSLAGVVVLRILTRMEKQWRSAQTSISHDGSSNEMENNRMKKSM